MIWIRGLFLVILLTSVSCNTVETRRSKDPAKVISLTPAGVRLRVTTHDGQVLQGDLVSQEDPDLCVLTGPHTEDRLIIPFTKIREIEVLRR